MLYFYGRYRQADGFSKYFKIAEEDYSSFEFKDDVIELFHCTPDTMSDLERKFQDYVSQRKKIDSGKILSSKIMGHKKATSVLPQKYFIGAKRSGNKRGYKFFLLTKEKFDAQSDNGLLDVILFVGTPIEANQAMSRYSQENRERFAPLAMKQEPEPPPVPGLKSGLVGIYQDNYGGHHALLISVKENDARMLFLTSNDLWNSKCRLITKEERVLLGRPNWGHENYFAPVTRPKEFFQPLGFEFPKHRVRELHREFWYPHIKSGT